MKYKGAVHYINNLILIHTALRFWSGSIKKFVNIKFLFTCLLITRILQLSYKSMFPNPFPHGNENTITLKSNRDDSLEQNVETRRNVESLS